MADIKTKDMKPKTVKTIDKAVAWTERIKDPVVYANEKVKDATDGQANVLDYGENKMKDSYKKNDNMTLKSKWIPIPKSNVIMS